MNQTIVSQNGRDKISLGSLVPFFLITFLIAWSILGLYIFKATAMQNRFGQITGNHPLFFLAVWSPAIAAFLIVGLKQGLTGIKQFVSSILL